MPHSLGPQDGPRLVDAYRAIIENLLPTLNQARLQQAIALARLQHQVRGFGQGGAVKREKAIAVFNA